MLYILNKKIPILELTKVNIRFLNHSIAHCELQTPFIFRSTRHSGEDGNIYTWVNIRKYLLA